MKGEEEGEERGAGGVSAGEEKKSEMKKTGEEKNEEKRRGKGGKTRWGKKRKEKVRKLKKNSSPSLAIAHSVLDVACGLNVDIVAAACLPIRSSRSSAGKYPRVAKAHSVLDTAWAPNRGSSVAAAATSRTNGSEENSAAGPADPCGGWSLARRCRAVATLTSSNMWTELATESRT